MKVVVQRSLEASVTVDERTIGHIDKGYVLLVAFNKEDTKEDVKKVAKKILGLRIFSDIEGKMNLNIFDAKGGVLSISQFTLYALLNGNRPSFTTAMNFKEAKNLYELFNDELKSSGITVEKGIFGADMKVNLINDGPVTIIIDSKEC